MKNKEYKDINELKGKVNLADRKLDTFGIMPNYKGLEAGSGLKTLKK